MTEKNIIQVDLTSIDGEIFFIYLPAISAIQKHFSHCFICNQPPRPHATPPTPHPTPNLATIDPPNHHSRKTREKTAPISFFYLRFSHLVKSHTWIIHNHLTYVPWYFTQPYDRTPLSNRPPVLPPTHSPFCFDHLLLFVSAISKLYQILLMFGFYSACSGEFTHSIALKITSNPFSQTWALVDSYVLGSMSWPNQRFKSIIDQYKTPFGNVISSPLTDITTFLFLAR